jgi:hypothetical protein
LVIPNGNRPETLTADGLLTYAARAFLRTLPDANTIASEKPRTGIGFYITQTGDTLFTIADKFGLTPETVLWSNRYLIGDTPDGIFPGQKLFIPPQDGVIHGWIKGESMDVVAGFYRVERDSVYQEPLNNISTSAFADPVHPAIRQGTMHRPFLRQITASVIIPMFPTWVSSPATAPPGQLVLVRGNSQPLNIGFQVMNSPLPLTTASTMPEDLDSGSLQPIAA